VTLCLAHITYAGNISAACAREKGHEGEHRSIFQPMENQQSCERLTLYRHGAMWTSVKHPGLEPDEVAEYVPAEALDRLRGNMRSVGSEDPNRKEQT